MDFAPGLDHTQADASHLGLGHFEHGLSLPPKSVVLAAVAPVVPLRPADIVMEGPAVREPLMVEVLTEDRRLCMKLRAKAGRRTVETVVACVGYPEPAERNVAI